MVEAVVKTHKAEIYEALKEKILTLELQPDQPLDEHVISAQYGMSRTPVREMLRRLANEGYVNIYPNQAARVNQMGLATMRSFISVAPLIFTAIGKLAVQSYKVPQLEELKKAHERFKAATEVEELQMMILANHRFLEVLGEMAASKYLEVSFSRLLLDQARMDMLAILPKGHVLQSMIVQYLKWQQEVINAVGSQDEERVAGHMRRFFSFGPS